MYLRTVQFHGVSVATLALARFSSVGGMEVGASGAYDHNADSSRSIWINSF
jgi:hypothetical protein